MGGTLFDSPLLHCFSNGLCHIQGKMRSVGDTGLPSLKNILRQALFHGGFIKYVAAENIGDIDQFVQDWLILSDVLPEKWNNFAIYM